MKNSKEVSKDLGDNFSNVVISSIKPRILLEKTLFMDTFWKTWGQILLKKDFLNQWMILR